MHRQFTQPARYLMLLTALGSIVMANWCQAAETERVLFEDPFQDKLADGWTWIKPDPTAWRIKDGKFQIMTIGGSSWQGNKDGANYLLRSLSKAKDGDFAVDVFAENRPTQEFEHVGLWWYVDDDNYVTLNKEKFGARSVVLFVVEKTGKGQPPFAEIPYEQEGIWLRLRFSGTQVTGQYRATPEDPWKTAGSRELPIKAEGRIGLHGGYSPKNDKDRWASFSHFRVVQITD